ncbi:MAG TPA: phosphoribosyl-ATP diphosphatase [Stellaceae bacterium]|nr:phosphoribosyl-ATP diphosphatase [Stellaceae bacterium]
MAKSIKITPKTTPPEADAATPEQSAKPAKADKKAKPAKPAKAAKVKDAPKAKGKATKAKQPAAPTAQPTSWVPNPGDPLGKLYIRVDAARLGDPEKSYTAKLYARGRAKIAQKLGEEAVETTIELIKGDRKGVIYESADLLYHLMVAWVDAGIVPDDVWLELQRRQGISGLIEKASRKPD